MIKSWCQIHSDTVSLNGETIQFQLSSGMCWKKQLYKNLDLDYPKFYKMDDLSKLCVLGVSMLEKDGALDEYGEEDVSMIFCNSNASTYTDILFKDSLEGQIPSPSLFVYTLPSVCIGELTILKQYYGSGCFYVSNCISSLPLKELIEIELSKGYKSVLISWLDRSKEKDFALFFIFENPASDEDLALIERSLK